MLKTLLLDLSLNKKLILMMLFLSFILIFALLFLYSHSEQALFHELERQTKELTQAIQIGVEEVTASGTTDEARLSKYLKDLNAKGIKEISIISNANEIVASTNIAKIGQPLTRKRKELIIKAELGEPVSKEEDTYNVILPVIAENTQYGYIHLKINKDDFSEILRVNAFKRIAATILVFGIGIIMAIILSRRYTKPIQKIVDAANRVAAGDLNQNISIQSKNEIGQLSASFNLMVQRLRENKLLERKLRDAEHLSGLSELSRSIAHEIRNPLNFINLSIDHIGDKYKPVDFESQKRFAQLISSIKQEIHRLNKLVSDFLNYSRPIKLNLKKVKVLEIIDNVTDLIWAKAEAEGIKIIKEYSSDIEVNIDIDLFKSCIWNICINAFHAMESSKERVLKIKTEIVDREFVLSIKDSGIGVSKDNIHKLFEPFFSTKQGGLGLGLPMTKRVMEEHGGKVKFISTEGKGSEVKLILPLSKGDEGYGSNSCN